MTSSFVDRFARYGGAWRQSGWYPVLFALLALLLLIQVIRLVWAIITPLGPVGDWKSSEVQVLAPQSRLALFSSFDPFFRSGTAPSANVVTSLQLTLYGIRMNEGSGLGSAILAGPDGVQESYAVGQEIMSGVTLDSVQFDYVMIDRGGVKESLYLDQSVPAETVGGDNVIASTAATALPSIPSAALAGDLDNVARFVPRNDAGRVTGIVVSPQGNGALFRSAGFRDGDIITSVNGSPVTSAADIENLKSQIKPGARVSVEVERGADTVPVVVNLGNQ